MAENKRVRIESHIEEYLKSQSERVLGKSSAQLTAAEISTLANAICYEHKLAQSVARQLPLQKLFGWLMSLVPSAGKVIQLGQPVDTPALKAPDDFEIDADLGDLYDEAA